MSLTPEQIADAVLVHNQRIGRGQLFYLRNAIWKWLNHTAWFEQRFPYQADQVMMVGEVENIIRTSWAKKAAKTRERRNKRRTEQEKLRQEAERQGKLDL